MFHPFERAKVRAVVFGFAALFVIGACAPAPRKALTKDQKQADMMWLFSQFSENYAPLEYKEAKLGFKFDDLKAKYLAEADTTASNEEFYRLMSRFVAEFQDAHTKTNQTFSVLPKRNSIAYLGFDGIRKGNNLLVTAMLPSFYADPAYPVQLGDIITKLDGTDLPDLVKKEAVLRGHLGNAESNLTAYMPKLFSKVSGTSVMPAADANAKLTIQRGLTKVEVEVPWITKDMGDFTREQQKYAKKSLPIGETAHFGTNLEKLFTWALDAMADQKKVKPKALSQLLPASKGYNYQDSFVYVALAPTWGSSEIADVLQQSFEGPAKPVDVLKTKRYVPSTAMFVNANATFPTYVTGEKVYDILGKATGETKLVATMYLDTFSPQASEDAVVKEVSDTLVALQTLGVQDLIIDMINNGGGSLSLGLRLAQLFSTTKITMPDMQFKLSNNWLDQFETESNANTSDSNDAKRELARRVFDGLSKDVARGDQLSSKWSTESLMPFTIKANDRLKKNMNIVLLTNEMCASMCDIFSAVLQDNKLAKVIGAKSMGAGGNVVMHGEAPNSHMWVSQTESLILRKDGSYIENNGVTPDLALPVSETSDMRYFPIRMIAIALMTTKTP